MNEPTSALTFKTLILEVARKIGVAYYGANGDEVAQIPEDAHDLAECKRHVNNAIRMFFLNGPTPNNWRFQKQLATVTLWPSIAVDSTNLVTSDGYTPGTGYTLLTASSSSFYESMEGKTITLTGVGDFVIAQYVSTTQISVIGDATAAGTSGVTWSLTADGSYTLPRAFGGAYTGKATYAASTDNGMNLEWTDESIIRQWRTTAAEDSGDPYLIAPRVVTGSTTRRWELLVYPTPDEVQVIQFPYLITFDALTDLTETPPTPILHDETIKAACLAVVEKDVEGSLGVDWDYFTTTCVPNSHRLDAMSAPRRLGYFGNSMSESGGSMFQAWRTGIYQRPGVTFNP